MPIQLKNPFSTKRSSLENDTETSQSRDRARYVARVREQTTRSIIEAGSSSWPKYSHHEPVTAEDAREMSVRGSGARTYVPSGLQVQKYQPRSAGNGSPLVGNGPPLRKEAPPRGGKAQARTSLESSRGRGFSFSSSDDKPLPTLGQSRAGIPARRVLRTKRLEEAPPETPEHRSPQPSEIGVALDLPSQEDVNVGITASSTLDTEDGTDDEYKSPVIKREMGSPIKKSEAEDNITPLSPQRTRSTSAPQEPPYNSSVSLNGSPVDEEKRRSRFEVSETDAGDGPTHLNKYLIALEENRELRVKSASERTKLKDELKSLKTEMAKVQGQLSKTVQAKEALDNRLLQLTQASQAASEIHTEQIEQLKFDHEVSFGGVKDKLQEREASIRGLEQTVRDHSQQLRTEAGRFNMAIEEKTQMSEAISRMKRQIETHQQQLDQKDQEHEKTKKGLRRYADVVKERHEKEINDLNSAHGKLIQERASAHAEEKSVLIKAHNDEMAKRDLELEEIEKEAEEEKKALEARHLASLEQLDEQHEAEKENLEQKIKAAQKEVADAKELVFAAQSEAANDLKLLKEKHEAESALLSKALSSEKSQLVSQQQEREKKLHASFYSKTLQLRQEVKDLNEALLRRDEETYQGEIMSTRNLPMKPDEGIRDDFFQIKDLVDRLGRLPWKKDQKFWTPDVFQRFGKQGDQKGDQRKLRNAIVQDLIWTQLAYHVFCSPFRVFGEEGLVLENEWREACETNPASKSELYNWPIPSVKAERWRYFTVKACRDVLSQELSQQDQRARLKKGFKNTHGAFIAALTAELSSIVDLTDENQKTLSKLWKEAARIWLEFGKYRCRIVISLTGSESRSTKQKVALAEEGSLVLTELPMVGRHGNVKGIELESFTVIDSCAGAKYPEGDSSVRV